MRQLVAPQPARWEFPSSPRPWDRHAGAIRILRIKFVPEPSGLVTLITGVGVLDVALLDACLNCVRYSRIRARGTSSYFDVRPLLSR